MKNKFNIVSLFIAVVFFFAACTEEKVEMFESYDSIKGDLTNSVQIFNVPSKPVEWFSINSAGNALDSKVTLGIKMIGAPKTSAVNVVIGIGSTSTAILDTHVKLNSTTVTIPAGASSVAFDVVLLNAGFAANESKILVVEIKSSDVALATASTSARVTLKENPFCNLPNGVADLVGTWGGLDADYTSGVTTVVDGADLAVSGLSEGFIADWWGEPVVKGGTFKMQINLENNVITIPRQYIYTTVYKGVEYEYEIIGSGKWNNCGTKPTLKIDYDIYYPGDAKGIAATYSSYFANPYLSADLTLGSKKAFVTNLVKPSFKK